MEESFVRSCKQIHFPPEQNYCPLLVNMHIYPAKLWFNRYNAIGVLILLGMAAALRLSLECCRELGQTRNTQAQVTFNLGYHPAI